MGGKLHMIRPADDAEIPWTALCLGLWIPNFFYWGLNQYIMQRTLASKSLAEGQMGIVFAAFLKLIIHSWWWSPASWPITCTAMT